MNTNFWLSMDDGVDIYVEKWYNPDEMPQAIVQLSHGMVEHINRYKEFAEYLVAQNIFVYGNDHRGHGKTGEKQGQLGFLSDEEGFKKVTEDLVKVTDRIQEDYPNTPIFLFGHSMGSFLARHYIQNHSNNLAGVILSGTGYYPVLSTKVGQMLASLLPPKKESRLMNFLSLGSNNKKIKGKKTNFDWLSNDEVSVQTYIDDPHTGYIPTSRFFYDLMTGLLAIHNKKRNRSIRTDLPILLISGNADPIGNYGKGIWKTAKLLESAGLIDITTMLIDNGLHELLHERNKQDNYHEIYTWIQKNL